MNRKTYRCSLHPANCGDGDETSAMSPEDAAESYLTKWDEQSLAADLIGLDLDEEKWSTVFVMDDEDAIWRVEVVVRAEVDYRADAKKASRLTEVFIP